MNAALLFIVTNCTCGWAVFYLLAEPAIFALILMVVRLRPNAAQCSPMQPSVCSPVVVRLHPSVLRSCISMCSRSCNPSCSRLQPDASQVVTDGEMCLVAGLAFQGASWLFALVSLCARFSAWRRDGKGGEGGKDGGEPGMPSHLGDGMPPGEMAPPHGTELRPQLSARGGCGGCSCGPAGLPAGYHPSSGYHPSCGMSPRGLPAPAQCYGAYAATAANPNAGYHPSAGPYGDPYAGYHPSAAHGDPHAPYAQYAPYAQHAQHAAQQATQQEQYQQQEHQQQYHDQYQQFAQQQLQQQQQQQYHHHQLQQQQQYQHGGEYGWPEAAQQQQQQHVGQQQYIGQQYAAGWAPAAPPHLASHLAQIEGEEWPSIAGAGAAIPGVSHYV